MTPTSRTMQALRELGFTAQVVERFCHFSKRRIDLFGFADIVAVREGVGIIAIQCTSGSNHAARREKIIAEPKAAAWYAAGGRIEVWSWAKQGARGERKTWTLRREEITQEHMIAA